MKEDAETYRSRYQLVLGATRELAAPMLALVMVLLALLSLPSGCSASGDASDESSGGESAGPSCDDRKSCTLDTLVSGACTHSIGPNSGDTACPDGEYCTVEDGCVAVPACASDKDCVDAWKGDACKADVACDDASSVCTFATLDKDGDGYPPQICGGGDCDDSDAAVHPEAAETCDGRDNDCSGDADESARCENSAEVCDEGICVCPPENDCDGACADVATDADNCGACGMACAPGEACVAGECACDPAECGEVFARSTSPRLIRLDSSHVYWTDAADGVLRASKANPEIEVLDSDGAAGLAIDTDAVFYLVGSTATGAPLDGALRRVSKTGGDSSTLVDGFRGGYHIALADDSVYFGEAYASVAHVTRLPKAGGDTETVVADLDYVGGLAADSSGFFWSTVGIYGGDTAVAGRELPSGPDVVLFDGSGGTRNPVRLALDDTTVYWLDDGTASDTDASRQLRAAPRTGGEYQTLATGFRNASDIALDDDFVYWTVGPECSVARVPKTGGAVETVATGACRADGVAVDDEYVYWADPERGQVRRIAKP